MCRFNATSPFAGHVEEPHTPRQNLPPLFVLTEDLQQLSSMAPRAYSRISSMPQDSLRRTGAGFASARSSSLRAPRNGSTNQSETTSASFGRMQSIQRQMSLSLRQVQKTQRHGKIKRHSANACLITRGIAYQAAAKASREQ